MKQIYFLLVVLMVLSLQSCQNNLSLPSPASRNYQQDVAVLNDFVDISKTTHEYYVNPNKKSTALSYLTNTDAEEFNAVNPVNLNSFKQSISQINSLSGQLASSHGVNYIVMITESEIYISQTKSNSPVHLKKKLSDDRINRSIIATCNITDYKEQLYVNSIDCIETTIELYPQSYKNAAWAFLVTCRVGHDGNKELASVLFCGVGFHINPSFEWSADQGNTVDWNFEVINTNGDAHIANLNFLH